MVRMISMMVGAKRTRSTQNHKRVRGDANMMLFNKKQTLYHTSIFLLNISRSRRVFQYWTSEPLVAFVCVRVQFDLCTHTHTWYSCLSLSSITHQYRYIL